MNFDLGQVKTLTGKTITLDVEANKSDASRDKVGVDNNPHRRNKQVWPVPSALFRVDKNCNPERCR